MSTLIELENGHILEISADLELPELDELEEALELLELPILGGIIQRY